MTQLRNQVIAITGAGSGIGQALAYRAAKQSAKLLLSDINPDALAHTVAQSQQLGATAVESRVVDVAQRATVEQWIQHGAQQLGQLDVLINNAGVALFASVEDLSYDDFEWLMNINFWGVVYGSKAALPIMRQQNHGHIVNISSLFGLIGVPNQSAYNAAKFAVRGFTESLAEEMQLSKTPINITCVHPGGIKTNIVNHGRFKKTLGVNLEPSQTSQTFNQLIATTSADSAAKQILAAISKNRRRLLIGPDAKALDLLQRALPAFYQKIISQAFTLWPGQKA